MMKPSSGTTINKMRATQCKSAGMCTVGDVVKPTSNAKSPSVASVYVNSLCCGMNNLLLADVVVGGADDSYVRPADRLRHLNGLRPPQPPSLSQ